MTTATAARVTTPDLDLDLDARLALAGAVMDERCNLALLAIDINTAHIPAADPIPEITAPPRHTPAPAPCPYTTPLAAVLWRARVRIETGGWCKGARRDEQGSVCLGEAIHLEAASRSEEADARALLLEAIRRDFRNAETIPSWQDAQRDKRLPLLYLDRAARLADARLI
jgi:hypothetical protein